MCNEKYDKTCLSRFADRKWSLSRESLGIYRASAYSGCSSSDEPKSQFAQTDASDVSALGNVEYHTYMLANELLLMRVQHVSLAMQ